MQENNKLNCVDTMFKKRKYHNTKATKVKKMSNDVWETLKYTQILDEREEEENSQL